MQMEMMIEKNDLEEQLMKLIDIIDVQLKIVKKAMGIIYIIFKNI